MILKRQVVHWYTKRLKVLAKMAHGCEEQCDAGLVTPDVGGFLAHFCHEDHILPGIQRLQQRTVTIQLVAEHDNQSTQPAGFR
jgi:hypothetical protein